MILEGIVTTVGSDGSVNISPMGPTVAPDMRRLTLRPFQSSQTYQNLKSLGEGVFHVTDDVETLARCAVGQVEPELKPALKVQGFILPSACRAYEFRVASLDDRQERTKIDVEVVRSEQLREYFGLNRAKHAVVEAAILATRIDFLSLEEIVSKFSDLASAVQKTGGPAEHRAFHFLESYIEKARNRRDSAGTRASSTPAGRGRTSVRIQTGSRLHFGLIAPATATPRCFGGAGLMVAQPGVDLTIEEAAEVDVTGCLKERAQQFAERVTGGHAASCRLRVLAAPREHTGLGTGTQLGLAIARGMAALRTENPGTAALATMVGRGRRSAIGVHGFEQGGFLVDGGKAQGKEGIAPLSLRLAVPEEWRFVLVTPREEVGISGAAETDAFDVLNRLKEPVAYVLSHVLHMGIVPALLEKDLTAFGAALREYGVRAGECFKKAQGGVYASKSVTSIIEFFQAEGIEGAGQSSWGPTVYAAVKDEDRAQHLRARLEDRFGSSNIEVLSTPPLNQGARVTVNGEVGQRS